MDFYDFLRFIMILIKLIIIIINPCSIKKQMDMKTNLIIPAANSLYDLSIVNNFNLKAEAKKAEF